MAPLGGWVGRIGGHSKERRAFYSSSTHADTGGVRTADRLDLAADAPVKISFGRTGSAHGHQQRRSQRTALVAAAATCEQSIRRRHQSPVLASATRCRAVGRIAAIARVSAAAE